MGFIQKFWFLLCAYFCFLNLHHFYEDGKLVEYIQNGETEEQEKLGFSLCFEFDGTVLDKFAKDDDTFEFTVKTLTEFTCHHLFSKELCAKAVRLNDSYLFNYHTCLSFKEDFFDPLATNVSSISYKIFVFGLGKSQVPFLKNLFTHEAGSGAFALSFVFNKITRLEEPYETECVDYSNSKLTFKASESVFSSFSCLSECFKSKSKTKTMNFYYGKKETERLTLRRQDLTRFGENKLLIGSGNLSLLDEQRCREECRRKGCQDFFFMLEVFEGASQTTHQLDYQISYNLARPIVPKFSVAISSVSLVYLFLNISLLETLPALIRSAFRNGIFSRFLVLRPILHRLRRIRKRIEISFTFFSLLLFTMLSLCITYAFLKQNYEVLASKYFPTESIPFYLFICVPLQVLIGGGSDGGKPSGPLDERREKMLLDSHSFAAIEALTNFDIFKNSSKDFWIQYGPLKKPSLKWRLDESKVLFRSLESKTENETNLHFLSRCFKIDFQFEELRYEMLYSLSELRFRLQFDWYAVFPVIVGQELNSEDNFLTSGKHLAKRVRKKMFDCLPTNTFNGKKCRSKRNCIDICALQKHLEVHAFLPVQAIVADIDQSRFNETRFKNQELDPHLVDLCEQQFVKENCQTENFTISQGTSLNAMNTTFEMPLYFAEFVFFENPEMTLQELLLTHTLSLQAIFLGFNVDKILVWLFIVLQRYNILKSSKLYAVFKFSVCLLGLTFHFYYLILGALNEELILLEKFENVRPVYLPNLIFCLKHNARIDENHQLTSEYLEEATKNLNASFFEKISVLNETFEEEFLDPFNGEMTGKRGRVTTFYFLDQLKCFELEFEDIQNPNYMKQLSEMVFVKIKFNMATILRYYESRSFELYFINKQADTEELNGIDRLEFGYEEGRKRSIILRQVLHVFNYEDRFSFLRNLRNPLTLFDKTVNLNDTTSYVQRLSSEFASLRLNTRTLPLELGSGFVIEDLLFDQYIRQVANVTDNGGFKEINYEREFYFTSFLNLTARPEDYDLKFYLMPMVARTKLKNRESYSSTLINILNTLNIWTNFCVLDIHLYIQTIFALFRRLYFLLIRFDIKLYHKKRHLLL